MKYLYQTHQIEQILAMPKRLPNGDGLELKRIGKEGKGRAFDTRPEVIDGSFIDMRYLGKAPVLGQPETYDASFLLANQRVRGVGYEPIGRQNFRFKKRIPKGWHLNVCDPNLPTDDVKQNIHHPLRDFSVMHFRDFIEKTAEMWKIEIGQKWERELFS